MRFFNTEGPVKAAWHYCIPPLSRVNLDEILEMIAEMQYFVLHAPSQTGKTSTLLALRDRLNAEGTYRCVYVNIEASHVAREDTSRAMRTVIGEVAFRARILGDDFVGRKMSAYLEEFGPDEVLGQTLVRWSQASPLPLVLLIDEIDTLIGHTLISVLRQLRANYDGRPDDFPQSVILCGVQDVCDWQIYSSLEGAKVRGDSAFNVKAKSLRLGDFSRAEVRDLLAEHTAEYGQPFQDGVAEHIWALTCGQPWLVNALAYQACFKERAGRDRSSPILVDAIERGRESLIREQYTHLDQFAGRLDEEPVRRVILPMLAGSEDWDFSPQDLEYFRGLGMLASECPVRMANPIYAEAIVRRLTIVLESVMAGSVDPDWHVRADGSLDMDGLLCAFQGYFRDHADAWLERFGHAEAGSQLMLYAYLHLAVNNRGRIAPEYAVGRGRTDLLLEWHQGGSQGSPSTRKYVLECKVRTERAGLDHLIREGCKHVASYMDRHEAAEGHLVIFDLRQDQSWDERVFRKNPTPGVCPITVWGV